MKKGLLDLNLGWRGVPGWFSDDEASCLGEHVRKAPSGTAVVELGSWCGRSLSVIAENLPEAVVAVAFDNHLPNSQAEVVSFQDSLDFLTAQQAKQMLETVVKHHQDHHRNVIFEPVEAVAGGRAWKGPKVSVLFVDDHHSPEQVQLVIAAWGPHLAQHCTLLFHDYGSEGVYGLQRALAPILISPTWTKLGQWGSIGVFQR